MDRMLYVAMTGARQVLHAQSVNNNNLANADTTGFRQDLAAARSMPVFGEGHPSRVYAMTERAGVDTSAGSLITTDRELDVAVDGDGWLAVQAPDGEEAYTRAGDLHTISGGILTNGAGHPIMGEGGPVALPPAEKIEIGADGTVSILPPGDPAAGLVEIDRILLVKPDPEALEKGADGLMRLRDGEAAPPDASVRLKAGALEGSNVDPTAALVNMIDLSRQYEMQIKMMSAAKDNARVTQQLLSLD